LTLSCVVCIKFVAAEASYGKVAVMLEVES